MEQKEPVGGGTPYSAKAVADIRRMAPLALPSYIAQCEAYDITDTRKVLDDVVREFEKDGGAVNAVLKPVAYSIADGLLEAIPGGAEMRRKGLTPQRIVSECEAFSYSAEDAAVGAIPGAAYVEWKNARGYREGELDFGKLRANGLDSQDVLSGGYAQRADRETYVRSELENQGAMEHYKDRAVEANGGRKNLRDEYTGERNITAHRADADQRRNDPTHRYQAQPDHIVPLESIHRQFRGNYALSKHEIRLIANQDGNLALTSGLINQKKGALSNREFVKKHGGEIPLTDAQKRNMAQMAQAAQKKIDARANELVAANLLGEGKISQAELSAAYAAHQKKARMDRPLTAAEKQQIQRELQRKKSGAIYGKAAGDAARQATDYAIGNVVLYLLKPLYWELKDSFRNGFAEGVGATSGAAAIRIRFGRIRNYLARNAAKFLGDNVWQFVKGFVSSLIEGIIGLFVGMFKRVLKLFKEGVRIFTQAAKVLWGENSRKMSAAEKGDAIVKLIGGAAASLIGIGVDALLAQIGTPPVLSVPLSTMLSGIVAALFMYLLDKVDLFSVKAERRAARVKEIFEQRVADLRADTARFNAAVTERLRQDWLEYSYLHQQVDAALKRQDMKGLDEAIVKTASLLAVPLPYDDVPSFVSFVESNREILIDARATGVA